MQFISFFSKLIIDFEKQIWLWKGNSNNNNEFMVMVCSPRNCSLKVLHFHISKSTSSAKIGQNCEFYVSTINVLNLKLLQRNITTKPGALRVYQSVREYGRPRGTFFRSWEIKFIRWPEIDIYSYYHYILTKKSGILWSMINIKSNSVISESYLVPKLSVQNKLERTIWLKTSYAI